MSFPYTEEQTTLRDTLRQFLVENCPSTYLRKRYSESAISDPQLWSKLNELGLIQSFAPESAGGLGLGFRELEILAFESGRSLLPEALYPTAFLGPYLFSHLLADAVTTNPENPKYKDLITGQRHIALAFQGNDETLSFKEGSISGNLAFVEWGGPEAFILVSDNIDLYLLDPTGTSTNIKFGEQPLVDGTTKCSLVSLNNAPATKLPPTDLKMIRLLYGLLKAAEICGTCDRALTMTLDHVKNREQFGVAIGSFQAVQHKLADAYLSLSALKALTNFAAWAVQNSPQQVSLASQSALHFAVEKGTLIIESCIQLTGGTGFTWEYDLHLHLRRVRAIVPLWNEVVDESILNSIH